ncbi:Hypothetical protein I5071_87380 [Sandaracinus amylolyticus]|nr:Hypothetical protein I5071_87380 [Sandaracinus amylolyticus]
MLTAWLCDPSAARAQTRTGGESLDASIERRVSVETGVGAWHPTLAWVVIYGNASAFASGRIGVWTDDERAIGTIDLEGTLRGYFGRGYDHAGEEIYAAIGGSTLSLMFGWSDRSTVRARGGPALVVPLAMLNGERTRAESLTYYGRALNGFWDPWDGFVRGPSVLARGDVDARFGALIIGGELAVGPSFWVLRADEGGPEEPVAVAHYQVAAYAGVQPIEWLALGARAQLVGWSDGGGRPIEEQRPADAQIALVPFVRVMLRPWLAELRGTLNLDEPDGLATRSRVWAVRLLLGVELGR